MNLSRFGVSMEHDLVELLDTLVERQGHKNRSEALRAMVRKELAHAVDQNETREVAGILTLLYPYGKALERHPTDDYPSLTISANLQLHLRGNVCLKVIVVQGLSADVHCWARDVIGQKGILGEMRVVASEDVYSAFSQTVEKSHARAEEHAEEHPDG